MTSTTMPQPTAGKRPHPDSEEGGIAPPEGSPDRLRGCTSIVDLTCIADTSTDDDELGPALPSHVPKKKKRRVLPYEKLYISALPSSQRYSKSLMHKEQLSFVTFTPITDFLITSSMDGVVKFWKKGAVGIESVKEFRAHAGEIRAVSVSSDGRSFATAGSDKTVKIFDVVTFGKLDDSC